MQPWEDRCLAPWAHRVDAVDASTLERIGRSLPWLRTLRKGGPDLLGGQISAVFTLCLQCRERVPWRSTARDHWKAHVVTLVESVHKGALLLVDRGSLSVPFVDHLTERGIWGIPRSGNQISSTIQPICSQGDGILDAVVSLGTTWDRRAPRPVRMLPCCWQGKHPR